MSQMPLPAPDTSVADAILRALIQFVALPLHSFVIFVAISLALRVSGRERTMLFWFVAGLTAGLVARAVTLLSTEHATALRIAEAGLLPAISSICFLVSLGMWWRQRGRG